LPEPSLCRRLPGAVAGTFENAVDAIVRFTKAPKAAPLPAK
jgi:hypothetical protein